MTDQQPQTQNKEEGLYEALRTVIDPEIGMNVVELGLIRGTEIHDDRAHIVMIMTTPFCPYAPQLLEQPHRPELSSGAHHHRDGPGNVGPLHDGGRRRRRLGPVLTRPVDHRTIHHNPALFESASADFSFLAGWFQPPASFGFFLTG